jgi:hypothetical protein
MGHDLNQSSALGILNLEQFIAFTLEESVLYFNDGVLKCAKLLGGANSKGSGW